MLALDMRFTTVSVSADKLLSGTTLCDPALYNILDPYMQIPGAAPVKRLINGCSWF